MAVVASGGTVKGVGVGGEARRLPLVLASTSPWRAALLQQVGWPFEQVAPKVDEGAWHARGGEPWRLAESLALEKARSVRPWVGERVVVGSDQVAAVGEELLTKPGSQQEVLAQLERLQGRSHVLYTAVALLAPGGVERTALVRTALVMRAWSREALEAYAAQELAIGCVGGYRLEGRGVALFASVEGPDPSAVVGLPLMALAGILHELGWPVFDPRGPAQALAP